MKMTADRVLNTIVNGPMGNLQAITKEIISKTASASPSNSVEIGRFLVSGPREGLDNDHVQLMVLVSLLFEEVKALRKEVKSLQKQKGDSAHG